MDKRTRDATLKQARERAERARRAARERSNKMYGGDADHMDREMAIHEAIRRAQNANRGGEDAVRHAVSDASRRAREARRRREEQDGGWAKGTKKTTKLQKRIDAKGLTGSTDSHRSFKAFVGGKELTGMGDKGVVTKRYFHGSPSAAAKKVVAILHKKDNKNVMGINNAVSIRLVEVTKGVRPMKNGKPIKGERFEHEYFGWRETIPEKIITKAGKEIPITARNVAVPKRKAGSAEAAHRESTRIGDKIKKAKGL